MEKAARFSRLAGTSFLGACLEGEWKKSVSVQNIALFC
jgi:hypothetical protein